MGMVEQPEILEPEVGQSDSEAGSDSPAGDEDPASDEHDDSGDGNGVSGSGFVPIAVGLAALLPLPYLSRRG